MRKLLVISFLFLGIMLCYTQENTQLKIYSFEQADTLQKKKPEMPIMVFVHTDWCKYCKKMELTTFADPKVIEILNKKVFLVSIDAEKYKEDITFMDRTFKYQKNTRKRGIHQIVVELASNNGRIEYPTLLILNNNNEIIFKINSYLNTKQMLRILERI